MELNNQVVVITGGSGGVGSELCWMFAKEGARVYFTYNSQKDKAEIMVKKMLDEGHWAKCLKCDVSDADDVKRGFNLILDAEKTIDILINNVGISCDSLLMNMTDDIWRSVIETNLNGVFYCCKNVLPSMMANGKGNIINLSSIVGSMGWPGLSHYAASKAGIEGFTRAAAAELGRFNIRVNAVSPGILLTDMSSEARDRVGRKMKRLTPLKTYGQAKDVAELIKFLVSDRASFITGEVHMVRGGLGAGLSMS